MQEGVRPLIVNGPAPMLPYLDGLLDPWERQRTDTAGPGKFTLKRILTQSVVFRHTPHCAYGGSEEG